MTINGPAERIFDKRLLFVSGKGGVGRTTVAAVLGLVAAERGLRTIVAGVGGRDELPGLFAAGPDTAPDAAPEATGPPPPARNTHAGAGRERELSPGLFSIAIDPDLAMEEYLRDQLPVAALADLLKSSRTFGYLAAATPGLRELLTVGKVWELAQPRRRAAGAEPYDLVIVDGPATGYGVRLLAAPGTFSRVARRGPISRHAATIQATLVDPHQTGVVGVSTPEEAAVSELVATRARLRDELGIALDVVIANAVRRQRFVSRDRTRLRAALAEEPTGTSEAGERSSETRRAIGLALSEDERIREQRRQLDRLTESFAANPVELPFVGTRELGRESLVELARAMDQSR